MAISGRISWSVKPQREVKRTSTKMIFISCEGIASEEGYFEIIKNIFSDVRSRIEIVSVKEDAIRTLEKRRTLEQKHLLSKSKPYQQVKNLDEFIEKNSTKYDFSNHKDDEFWIVVDVDDHTNEDNISEWNETISECETKGYGFAVSNPFFELWLLLHHTDVVEEDYNNSVTFERKYDTAFGKYYRERLKKVGAQLKKQKYPKPDDYSKEKVLQAIIRAKKLQCNSVDKWPTELGSTVYLILEKIVEMLPDTDSVMQ